MTSLFADANQADFFLLRDVTLNDLISVDELWSVSSAKESSKKNKFSKLPEKFFVLKDWPTKCNLSCCSCGMTYNTTPISMPERTIITDDGKLGFIVRYNYCSFSCCWRAILTITDTSMRNFRLNLLKLMFTYYFSNGIRLESIDPGPDPKEMSHYGGTISISEFKKKINKITTKLVGDVKLDRSKFILETIELV